MVARGDCRAFGAERDRARRPSRCQSPVDEQAAQRPPGIVGRNGGPLREGVRVERRHVDADAVGA